MDEDECAPQVESEEATEDVRRQQPEDFDARTPGKRIGEIRNRERLGEDLLAFQERLSPTDALQDRFELGLFLPFDEDIGRQDPPEGRLAVAQGLDRLVVPGRRLGQTVVGSEMK